MRILGVFLFFVSIYCHSQSAFYNRYRYSNGVIISDDKSNDNLVITKSKQIALATIKYYKNNSPLFSTSSAFIKTDFNGNIIFKKTFRSPDDFMPTDLLYTSDNGFLLTGHSHEPDTFGGNATNILIKTDSSGNVQWSKIIGAFYGGYGYKTVEIDDSTYFGIGSDTNSAGNIFCYKIKKNGNLLFGKTFGRSNGTESARSLIYSNGSVYILGNSSVSTGTYKGCFLTKMDLNGNIIWTKEFSFSNQDMSGYFITKINNNKFCISGYNCSAGTCLTDGNFLLEIDTLGNKLNAKSYDIDFLDELTSIEWVNKKGYGLSWLATPSSQFGNFYSILVDSNLNITSAQKLNNSSSVFQNQGPTLKYKSGHWFFGGLIYYQAPTSAVVFLMKLDSIAKNPCLSHPITINSNTLTLITNTINFTSSYRNTSFVIPSYTSNMIIPDSAYCSAPLNIGVNSFENNIVIFPNPLTGNELEISSSIAISEVSILNLNGKLIMTQQLEDPYKSRINFYGLKDNFYIISFKTSEGIIRKKVITIK